MELRKSGEGKKMGGGFEVSEGMVVVRVCRGRGVIVGEGRVINFTIHAAAATASPPGARPECKQHFTLPLQQSLKLAAHPWQ